MRYPGTANHEPILLYEKGELIIFLCSRYHRIAYLSYFHAPSTYFVCYNDDLSLLCHLTF